MQYQITTAKAADLAEFFNADLAGNGLSMTADGDRLQFDADVLAHLREHRTSDEDGHISDVDGVPTMWIGGTDYPVESV